MPRTFPWTMLQRWAREHRTSRAASARFNIAGALVSFKSPTDSSDSFWLPEGADTGRAGEADIVFSLLSSFSDRRLGKNFGTSSSRFGHTIKVDESAPETGDLMLRDVGAHRATADPPRA